MRAKNGQRLGAYLLEDGEDKEMRSLSLARLQLLLVSNFEFLQDCRVVAKTTRQVRTRRGFNRIIAGNDPGAGDGILAQFHAEGEHRERTGVNPDFLL